MSDLIAVPKHKADSLAKKLKAAQAESEALRARVSELEATLYHGNLEREKCQKVWLLHKQAEAIEAATKACEIKSATDDSRCYSIALMDYADGLKRKADATERAGGDK